MRHCHLIQHPPLPVNETVLMYWVASLVSKPRKLSYSTVVSYLSAVSTCVKMQGHTEFNWKDMYQLSHVVRAIRKHHNPDTKPRLPITYGVLQALKPYMDINSYTGQMHWAAFTVAVAGLLRSGEFTVKSQSDINALQYNAIKWLGMTGDEPGFTLTLPRDKTSSKPVEIFIARTESVVCAYYAIRRYLHTRQKIYPSTFKSSSPLFANASGAALTRHELTSAIERYTQAAKLPNWNQYKGHSFRRGGATALAGAQVQDSVIRNIGRWRSYTSQQLYVETTYTQRVAVIQRAVSVSIAQQPSVFMDLNNATSSNAPWELSEQDVMATNKYTSIGSQLIPH